MSEQSHLADRPVVAVVDDEPEIGDIVRRALKRNYRVETFETAEEILKALEEGRRFAVVLCDLYMPERSGRQIYDEIATRWPEQASRVIFMSGISARGARGDLLSGVDNDMMEKPFRLKVLRQTVEKMAKS